MAGCLVVTRDNLKSTAILLQITTLAWQDIRYLKDSKRKQDFSCIFAWQDIRYPNASKRKKDFSCIVLTQYPPLFSLDNGTRNLYVITTCLENRVAIICP